MKTKMIEETERFVRQELGADSTGHDWFHIDRVRNNAIHIWEQEQKGDPFMIEMTALLHDIPDDKLNETHHSGEAKLDSFLLTLPLSEIEKQQIKQMIESISFKGGRSIELPSIEAAIVQDADRLDAIGAIGIARTFAYGGTKGQPIYDPEISVRDKMTVEEYRKGKSTSIHHFYEKLLKLKDLMNTETAIKMAAERQRLMELFLDQFFQEWNGKI